jgi:hypothetical protein
MAIGGFASYKDIVSDSPDGFGSLHRGMKTGKSIYNFNTKEKDYAAAKDAYGNGDNKALIQEFLRQGDYDSANKVLAAEENSLYRNSQLAASAGRDDPFTLFIKKEQFKNDLDDYKKNQLLEQNIAEMMKLKNMNSTNSENFDSGKKNLSDFKGTTNWTRGGNWSPFVSKKEVVSRNNFQTYKDKLINTFYQSLKGAGAITDTELENMAKSAKNVANPYELDQVLESQLELINARKNAGNSRFAAQPQNLNNKSKYIVVSME